MRNRPVYPHLMSHCQIANMTETWPGISVREHAAITLRVPNSGDDQLDAMIRQANRRDAAVAAMQGMIIRGEDDGPYAADCAIRYADALLARMEESNNEH